MPDSKIITIKQNGRVQVGVCPEKFQLDQMQNGWLSVIIDFKAICS